MGNVALEDKVWEMLFWKIRCGKCCFGDKV